jgi:BlaI family transcriptional regulator, penicillinase repressor
VQINLGDREAQLMDVLWERGPSTVAEVRAQLEDELAYTTVLTMLRTLEDKGYVRHEAEGRAHRYLALIAREAARRSALRHLAGKLFKGSPHLLLAHMVSDGKLSDAEVRSIRKLLAEHGKKKS